MKRTIKLLSVLLVLACLLACLPILSASAAVPTTATVTTSKSNYAVGEDVVFTINANGAITHLWVYRVDGQWQNTYMSVGASTNIAFGWEGEYKALVQTWNGTDNLISEYCYFTIGNANPPTSATIGADKSVYKIGDIVTFNMSGDGNTNTLWIYGPSGTQYFEQAGTSYTYIPTVAGQYEALMETWNGAGSFCSEKIKFRVVDPNAPVTTPSTTKATTTATTTASTTASTTAPTTASTTAPTTASTTAPTTISTTRPTTVSTTRPTTIKPPVQDPCANGHKYQNGHCIYCAKVDPNYNPCALGHTFQNGFCIYCLREDPTYDPCAEGHTFENGWCVYCLAQEVHNYVGGICMDCFQPDPNYQDPCANGHDLNETGSCKNCSYYDPDFDPNAPKDNATTNTDTGSKSNDDGGFWLWFWIILILFIVFLVLAILLISKKKKPADAPDGGAAE